MKKLILSFALLLPVSVYVVAQQQYRNYDVINYSISIDSIDISNKRIFAKTNILLQISSIPDSISFDLLQLTINDINVNGQNASFSTIGSTFFIPSDFLIQGQNQIVVQYSGTPYSESWGGVVFDGEYVYNLGVGINTLPHNLGKAWFPCNDNFSDKATFEYYVTVPYNKYATCGGVLVDIIDNGNNTKTFHYKSDKELSAYQASFAVGDYVLIEDLHNGTIPITYVLKPNQVNAAQVLFQNIHKIIDIFENKFGSYAFERIGYTATSIGAMEHQNNISFPNSCITANLTYESLYAHELFHSWFGNLITCKSAEDMWINEGWATFGQYYFEELLYDKNKYLSNIKTAKNTVITKAHLPAEDNGYYPLNNIPQHNTYGVSTYERGALVVHSLRSYLGDEVFFNSVKSMLNENKFSSLSSEDLCKELSKSSGVSLDGFFDNFVYQAGSSAFVIDSFNIVNGNNLWYTDLFIQQKLYNRTNYSSKNRVEITFMNLSMETENFTVEFDGRYGYSYIVSHIEPTMIFVNYYDKIYDAKFNSDKIIKTTGLQNLQYANFKIEPYSIQDSSYIHVNHYLVSPNDPLNIEGRYRLSNNHFWTINILDFGSMNSSGYFYYSKSGLDSDLISSNQDSLVLMYRKNYDEKWQRLNVTKYGQYSVGELVYENLKSGEYAFAVIDSSVNSIASFEEKNKLLIFPNPSNTNFTVCFDADVNNNVLEIFDIKAKLIKKYELNNTVNTITWTPSAHLEPQHFIFVLSKKNGYKLTGKATLINKK